jgi:cyclopropane-fatty-acyl-phospholipid synthase
MDGEGSADRIGTSPAAIAHHYDVGNEFFALWLDPSRTYSCALWYGDEELHTAQLNKLDWHLRHSGAAGARRLLDVGCGWGSALQRAVESYGVADAVGLTLSRAQAAWIEQSRVPGIEARVENWADHVPIAPYDAIVSIGAFEHFARLDQSVEEKVAVYRAFFQFCRRVAPSGCLSLQSITYESADRAQFSPFFARHVFPESDLPRLSEIVQATERLFEIELIRNDREQYARTARHWLAQLRRRRADAVKIVGEEVVGRYERYLALLVIGFHTGTMGLVRMALRPVPSR